jgi:hypothetical protein
MLRLKKIYSQGEVSMNTAFEFIKANSVFHIVAVDGDKSVISA